MSAYRIIVRAEPYNCHYAASRARWTQGVIDIIAFIIPAQLIGLAIPVSALP
jgi:hypothetical protein